MKNDFHSKHAKSLWALSPSLFMSCCNSKTKEEKIILKNNIDGYELELKLRLFTIEFNPTLQFNYNPSLTLICAHIITYSIEIATYSCSHFVNPWNFFFSISNNVFTLITLILCKCAVSVSIWRATIQFEHMTQSFDSQ